MLTLESDRLQAVLQAVADALQVPVDDRKVRETILKCNNRLLSMNPLTLRDRLACLCSLGMSPNKMRRAIMAGAFDLQEHVMQDRADYLVSALDMTTGDLGKFLSKGPHVLKLPENTVDLHLAGCQKLGFTRDQSQEILRSCPSLTFANWETDVRVHKHMFFTHIMHLDYKEIVERVIILTYALARMGARWQFMRVVSASWHKPLLATHVRPFAIKDEVFAAQYSSPVEQSHCVSFYTQTGLGRNGVYHYKPAYVYNEAFRNQWKQKWDFLVNDVPVSIDVIGAHASLMKASLCQALGPRLHFIPLLSASSSNVSLEDQLTTLAEVSDVRFAALYNNQACKLIFDNEFINLWQKANKHLMRL